ncbi:MAG: hypothetical protein IJ282_00575 [Lachnospiraceae bacterium]|nr:hypothetical protein [Lachnospiraceae bacterium]
MTIYEDYKYVMQDAGNIYLGAKYTYEELIENEDVTFKLKAVMQKYILAEAKLDPATTLESHFYFLEPGGFVFEVCKQLKIKVKYAEVVVKKNLFGKKKEVYETKTLKIEKFAELTAAQKEKTGVIVQEIGISKLALMAFNL